MRARSIPASFASRRARGEENTRFARAVSTPSPSPRLDAGACAGAGAARGGSPVLGATDDAPAAPTEASAPGAGRGGAASAGFGADGDGFAAAGAPLPAAAAAALTSSPSSARTAMSVLTGTSGVPSGTTILAIVPSSTASYSIA